MVSHSVGLPLLLSSQETLSQGERGVEGLTLEVWAHQRDFSGLPSLTCHPKFLISSHQGISYETLSMLPWGNLLYIRVSKFLINLSIHLWSSQPCTHLYIYSYYPSLYPHIHPYLLIFLSIHLSIATHPLFTHPSIYLRIICLLAYHISIHPHTHQHIHPPARTFIHLSVCPCVQPANYTINIRVIETLHLYNDGQRGHIPKVSSLMGLVSYKQGSCGRVKDTQKSYLWSSDQTTLDTVEY